MIRMSLMQVIAEYNKRLMGYATSMSYNFCQLCVKADTSSLLPIEMMIGGEMKHIEDVAYVVLHKKEEDGDDVTIDLFYKDKAYISDIIKAVVKTHPEFSISIHKMEQAPEDDDSLEFKFIRLVMPEVDKTRRDLLLEVVKALRDKCKVNYDIAKAKATAELAPKSIGVPKEELDEVNQEIDKCYESFIKMADSLTDEKKKQIEDAYQEYLENHKDNEPSANSSDGKTGMKLQEEQKSEAKASEASKPEPQPSETPKPKKIGQSLKME